MPAQTEAVDLDNANEPGAEPAAAQQQRPRRREEELSPYARRLRLYGLLFVAPWIIGFVLFTLWPALTSILWCWPGPAAAIGCPAGRPLSCQSGHSG